MKGVPHFKKDGTMYKGATHKDAKGKLMSGKTHTKRTVFVYHINELPKKSLMKAQKITMDIVTKDISINSSEGVGTLTN